MYVDVVDLVDTYQPVDFLGRSLDLTGMCSVVDAVVMVGGEGIFKRVGLAVGREGDCFGCGGRSVEIYHRF